MNSPMETTVRARIGPLDYPEWIDVKVVAGPVLGFYECRDGTGNRLVIHRNNLKEGKTGTGNNEQPTSNIERRISHDTEHRTANFGTDAGGV